MRDTINRLFVNQQKKSQELRIAPIADRKAELKKLKKWILTHKDRIRKAVYTDLRKPESDIDITEIFTVTSEINHALRKLNVWTEPKRVSSGFTYIGTSAKIMYEPKGRCLIIAPWNFPFQLMVSPLVSCLAAGNTAILKPSENTPATSTLIKEMISELYAPELVTVVEGAIEETQILLSLPFDHIFFTGSTAVGKIIMAAAAKNLTSVTLELGGKSPVIIDQTADTDDAARKIVWGRFTNNGQTCIAPDYIFIHTHQLDSFVASTKKYIAQLFDPESQGMRHADGYSRIVNEKQANRLVDILNDAVTKGAKVIAGGDHDVTQRYIEPTLLTHIDETSRIWQEEIFGPIMPIQTYDDLATVIQHINTQEKPLSLYLFSKSSVTQKLIEQQTSAGSMVINDVVIQYAHPNLPFGGVNHSGIGKSHGHFGFLEFSNQKSILKQRIGLTNASLFYPPVGGFKKILLKWMINHF
ncbi:aldehyde dehydrogenase family protein [Reichenbachiella agarivorans]|uniref:Aldehyde dehydrogenase n=1 Tax=Reichenbachiella agarivorans TaxID=2979464 RepID=A0ABY6CS24_9BACT|nr:aldehyde dehydrogenase family protein [Reichenbachiella agarivorans]UXP32654.1 aldehyde dehydrogenase family protein [Reichenbachiella agarivorans]